MTRKFSLSLLNKIQNCWKVSSFSALSQTACNVLKTLKTAEDHSSGEGGCSKGSSLLSLLQLVEFCVLLFEFKSHNSVYAPKAHIMYLTVFSWFLISFVMGGGGVALAGWLSSFMHLLPHPLQYGPWNLPRELLYIKPPMHLWFIQPYA